MVTDSAEKAQEENRNDCESRASNTKEIPRWNGVANISCPKLDELFSCQKVAHSVLFYILIFLFLLVFVYILRKLVSLPSGLVKYNSRKPNNNASTATAVRNHSSDSLPKRLPTKWPKMDKITDHLAAHLSESTAVTTSKDKKSRIYNVPGGSGQSYGWSGFLNNNPNPNLGETTPSHVKQGLQNNYQGYGKIYPDVESESYGNDKENVYKSSFNNKIPESSPSITKPSSTDASFENSESSSWNYPENSRFGKTRIDSSVLNYPGNSGFENTRNEWSAWDYPANSGSKKTSSDWSAWDYPGNTDLGIMHSPLRARSFPGYSGSDLAEGSNERLQQTGDLELRSRVTTPMASGDNYVKWGSTSSPWVKSGSSWPAGSGFGWLRAGDHDSKNPYGSQSSFPRNRFNYDENRDTYGYNHNPTGQTGDDSSLGYSSYNKATNANNWNPYYNHVQMNQTEDWNKLNVLNGQNDEMSKISSNSVAQDYFGSFGPSATTNDDQGVNQQHQVSPQVAGEEKDERIHRWPLEEGRVEESVDESSSHLRGASHNHDLLKPSRVRHKKSKHRLPFREKTSQGPMMKKQHKPGRPKRKKQKKKITVTKTQVNNHVKKSKIPHHGVSEIHSKRRQVKHWQVKSKVKSKVKPKVKGKTTQLPAKVSRLKTRLDNKRRPTKTMINEHRSKNSSQRFRSYASYKNFIKKHQLSDILVGKWRRTMHHVRKCKKLSQFKTKGKVLLSRKYLHHERKYRYTVLSCKYIDNGNNANDGGDDIDDDNDKVSPSGNQICREFWFITTGRITLRKITEDHSGNTYTLTLCKKGSGTVWGKDTPVKTLGNKDQTTDPDDDDDDDANTDTNKKNGNDDSNDNDEQDLNSDVSSGDTDPTRGNGKENADRDIHTHIHTDNDSTDTNEGAGDKYDDDVDSDDKTGTNKRTDNDRDDDDDDDDDRDLDDDDDDVDSNGPGKTKGHGSKRFNDDKNSDDDDFDRDVDNDNDNGNDNDSNNDNDNDSDKDNENTNTDKEIENDGSTTKTDDTLTNTNSGDGRSETHNNVRDDEATESDSDLDDIDIDKDRDEDVDAENKHTPHRKHRNSPKRSKTNKTKTQRTKSKTGIKKSLIPKPYHKHVKKRNRMKVTKKRKHKTTLKKDATNDNSNIYERLLEGLTKSNNINDKNTAIAKLVAAISHKKSNAETTAKRVKNKKSRTYSRNNNKKKKKKNRKLTVKGNQIPFFNTPGITNANVKILLQNLLTNSNNVQSPSQVMRKQPTPEQKGPTTDAKKGGRPKEVSTKPGTQVDMKDVLKVLLPSILSRSTSMTTAAPSHTAQPTRATMLVYDQNLPILNLISKHGMKSTLNGNMTTLLQGLLPGNKPKNSLGIVDTMTDTKSTSAITPELAPSQAQQRLLVPHSSEPSSLNPSEQLPGLTTKPGNSLRSFIPTAVPSQNYPFSPPPNQLLPSPTPPTYTTEERNAIAVPTTQGPGDKTANQSPYGYSAYRSKNSNPYSYETPSINVLCFGDSLTSGYYNHGRRKHPYSIRLNQLLNAGGKHRYKIVTRGVVGEMAHGSMTKRLPKLLNEGTRFDWVIILGGTNDVAHVKNFGDDEDFTQQLISVWSPKIVNDIEKLHETARRYGARTVLMTIPETAYELRREFQSIRNMRLSVNAALRKYATQVRDTTVLCDLAYKLPRSSLSKELQKFYWNDHIHLNPVGYNKMAEVIVQCIRPYLTK